MSKTLVVEDVLDRIQQITEELNLVRGEICNHVFTSQEPHGPNLFSTNSLSVELMTRFKGSLDDVRHLVWLYLEAVSECPIAVVDKQRRLLNRATEILGALSQRPPLPAPAAAPSERSLLDRLLQLIDNRIDPRLIKKPDGSNKNGRVPTPSATL